MLSDQEIGSMTIEERVELSRKLARYNGGIGRETQASGRRRTRIINILVVVCLGLIP